MADVKVKFGASTTEFSKGIGAVKSQVSGLTGQLGKMGGVAGSLIGGSVVAG